MSFWECTAERGKKKKKKKRKKKELMKYVCFLITGFKTAMQRSIDAFQWTHKFCLIPKWEILTYFLIFWPLIINLNCDSGGENAILKY